MGSLVNKKKSKSQFKKFSELFFILRGYLFQRFRHFKVDTMFGPLLPQTTQAQVNSARGQQPVQDARMNYKQRQLLPKNLL